MGDMSQAVYSIRQDITFKILDQTVIQDPVTGEIIYNLAQQDMVAIRAVMRIGWEIPNPITALNDGETRFPFALIEPAVAPTTYDVTFTVTDAQTNAVKGAKVSLGSQVKKTNSAGQAVFKSNANTSWLYSVKKDGVNTVFGEVEVGTEAKEVTVNNFA